MAENLAVIYLFFLLYFLLIFHFFMFLQKEQIKYMVVPQSAKGQLTNVYYLYEDFIIP